MNSLTEHRWLRDQLRVLTGLNDPPNQSADGSAEPDPPGSVVSAVQTQQTGAPPRTIPKRKRSRRDRKRGKRGKRGKRKP